MWPGPSGGWNVTGRRGRRSPSRGTTPLVYCGVPGLTVWSDWLATYHVCVIVTVRDGRGSVLQCFAQYRRLRGSRLSPGRWTKLSHGAAGSLNQRRTLWTLLLCMAYNLRSSCRMDGTEEDTPPPWLTKMLDSLQERHRQTLQE